MFRNLIGGSEKEEIPPRADGRRRNPVLFPERILKFAIPDGSSTKWVSSATPHLPALSVGEIFPCFLFWLLFALLLRANDLCMQRSKKPPVPPLGLGFRPETTDERTGWVNPFFASRWVNRPSGTSYRIIVSKIPTSIKSEQKRRNSATVHKFPFDQGFWGWFCGVPGFVFDLSRAPTSSCVISRCVGVGAIAPRTLGVKI